MAHTRYTSQRVAYDEHHYAPLTGVVEDRAFGTPDERGNVPPQSSHWIHGASPNAPWITVSKDPLHSSSGAQPVASSGFSGQPPSHELLCCIGTSPSNVPLNPRGRSESFANNAPSNRSYFNPRTLSNASRSEQACEDCEETGLGRFMCNVCEEVYCDDCWNLQRVHRRPKESYKGPPHEKTELDLWRVVRQCLRPNMTPEEREAAHEDDINTTWFGVVNDKPYPIFRDYGKFADIVSKVRDSTHGGLSPTDDSSDIMCPSLTSFVGQTGAGKSTLIKLLIQLRNEEMGDSTTPVAGAASSTNPTSEDVHLYLAPGTSDSTIQLFADCEGLDGGERDPYGARVKRHRQKRADAARNREGQAKRKRYLSERDLEWATTPGRRKREFIVSQLYPRVLYTFSDVIIFAHREKRTIESVFERLFDWAMNAIETSNNQPVLPHAIIIFNAVFDNIAGDSWDHVASTKHVLNELQACLNTVNFKKYLDFWRERGRSFESFEQLVEAYYGSITVMNMPTGSRPNLLKYQIDNLQKLIKAKSNEAGQKKLELRMLLDSEEYGNHLSSAFDHFARHLNMPFDFVKASFAHSPIPSNFAGNIVKLARQVTQRWPGRSGRAIFEELSYLIASCITLDAARSKIRGEAGAIFKEYCGHIEEALGNFCDQHWACEYILDGIKCVNVRAGHDSKGHQGDNGKIMSMGGWQSEFTYEDYVDDFCDQIFHKLEHLRNLVNIGRQSSPEASEIQIAANIHKHVILQEFFTQATQGHPDTLTNHSVCLCCLFEAAEHALPCGHIICTPCLQIYGHSSAGSRSYTMFACPMEKNETFTNAPRFVLKPPNCGIRILTLDGGGVKGVVELEILRHIERLLGEPLMIKHFFDLIVGTSAGGVIALGLTTRNWTVTQCLQNYRELCQGAFKKRPFTKSKLFGWAVEQVYHSKYETSALEQSLQNAFGDKDYLFGGIKVQTVNTDIKIAVTATTSHGHGIVFSNYNRLAGETSSYQFYRPEDASAELKVWEIARATSAAPRYFRPFYHTPAKQVLLDGGIYHNNPIRIAEKERKLIWPLLEDGHPDIVVSIGGCYGPTKRKEPKKVSNREEAASRQFLIKIARDRLKAAQNTEDIWDNYISDKAPEPEDRPRFVRLNPEMLTDVPKLDDINAMDDLQKFAKDAIKSDPRVLPLAKRLVASSFYFACDNATTLLDDTFEVAGLIMCRFPNRGQDEPGSELKAIGDFINANSGKDPGFQPCFEIRVLSDQPQIVKKIKVDIDHISRFRTFHTNECKIHVINSNVLTEIVLCYQPGEEYPISGFPRRLHQEKTTLSDRRRAQAPLIHMRWGMRNSKRLRKNIWQPSTGLRRTLSLGRIQTYNTTRQFSEAPAISYVHDISRSDMYEMPGAALRLPEMQGIPSIRSSNTTKQPVTPVYMPPVAYEVKCPPYEAKALPHPTKVRDVPFFYYSPESFEPPPPVFPFVGTVKLTWSSSMRDRGYLDVQQGEVVDVTGQDRTESEYHGANSNELQTDTSTALWQAHSRRSNQQGWIYKTNLRCGAMLFASGPRLPMRVNGPPVPDLPELQ